MTDPDGGPRTVTLGATTFSYTVPERLRAAGARIAALEPSARHGDWRIAVRDEAIASANYEGARVPRHMAVHLLGPPRWEPSGRGETMVSNVYDAMLAARDDPAAPLTPATILRYHGIVAAGAVDDPADAGAFRRRDDIVVGNALTGKVIYRPPPAGALPRLVFELCRWHAATDEDPFVAAALLHYFVGWLHPFVDGNGRTARVLWYWACARHAGLDRVWHLSLSGGIAEDWRPYNKGFRLAQQSGDITPFLERQALYLERVVAAVAGRA